MKKMQLISVVLLAAPLLACSAESISNDSEVHKAGSPKNAAGQTLQESAQLAATEATFHAADNQTSHSMVIATFRTDGPHTCAVYPGQQSVRCLVELVPPNTVLGTNFDAFSFGVAFAVTVPPLLIPHDIPAQQYFQMTDSHGVTCTGGSSISCQVN